MSIHEDFLRSIQEKRVVRVKFNSISKGLIERKCIPYDFGPGKRIDGYHFYDLDSQDSKGPHNLSEIPERVLELKVLDEHFEPSKYVTWKPPYGWHIKRDWGEFS